MRVVVIPHYNNPYQDELAKALAKHSVTTHYAEVFPLFSIIKASRKYWKPDVVHVHWTDCLLMGSSKLISLIRSTTFILEIMLIKLLRIRLVWTIHNIVSHESPYPSLELFYNRLLARFADTIFVHSQFVMDEVIRKYKIRRDAITIIPHGNYINCYPNVISRDAAREKLGITPDIVLFLFLGLIRPYKGVMDLVDAFEQIDNKRAHLIIAGRPLDEEIARQITTRCHGMNTITTRLEMVPDEEVQVYMNAADVVVFPYKRILTSGALLLAMSFGKAIIAPAIGFIPDVLDEKGSIIYSPPETAALRDAMARAVIPTPDKLAEMGHHNFILAQKCDWEDIAKVTLEIYKGKS